MRINAFVISFLLLGSNFGLFAQEYFDVQLRFFKTLNNLEVLFPEESLHLDSTEINSLINHRLSQLYEFGYLATTYNIVQKDSANSRIDFFAGEVYTMAKLGQGNVSDEILNKTGFRPLQFREKPFSHNQLAKLMNAILDYAENHGYPFASIKLDSISINSKTIEATLYYSSGPKIVFDSLIIEGNEKIKTKYLATHLGIYKDKLYEENIVKEIPNKIKLLPFLELNSEPEVIIKQGRCNIKLNLKQEKVSRLDGILGVLPNQKDGNKVLVTGQLILDLHNLFLSGKRIAFEWQSFDAQSQFLDMKYFHPNLLKSPLNIEGSFELLKQDTSFLNRSLGLELSFITRKSSHIGFTTDFFTSRIISAFGMDGIGKLPNNNDFNLNYYGLNYELNRFNNINHPSSGWAFSFAGLAGQKKILKIPAVDESIYDDVKTNTLQIKLDGTLDKYWPFHQFLVLRTRFIGGYIRGDNLFPGDLYRIGGLNTLRGFTEKSIYASSYAIANLELRAYLSEDAYFMLFFDQSYIENTNQQENVRQYPFGTGLGLSFKTNSGIFNFAIAMGKSNEQPFAFNYSKIHFGYIARF